MTATPKMAKDDQEWKDRIEAKLDELRNRQSDDMQLRANVSYIFQPGGIWEQYGNKVMAHETSLQRANGAIITLLAIGITSLLAWGKNLITSLRHP